MKILNKFLEKVLAAMVAFMVLGCFWQVFTRFILNSPSKYTEELLRYMLIWLTMLGVPYAYGKERHLSINLLTRDFSPKGALTARIFIEVLITFLSVFVMVAGGLMVTANSAGQISPALHLPMQVYYVCIPISGVLMVIYSATRLVAFLKQWKEA
ncbi:MAG: TRAP transporter small permease [Enterocloster sp.]